MPKSSRQRRSAASKRRRQPVPELAVGLQHHQAGELQQAQAIYRAILATRPRHSDALGLLGIVALQQGNTPEACQLLQQAIAINPGEASYHANLGLVLQQAGQLEAAMASLHEALRRQPAFPEAWNNLGQVFFDSGRYNDALASYQQALSLRPAYPEAWNNLGQVLTSLGHLEDAVASFREALRQRPHYPEAHYNLGVTYHALGEFAAALASYGEALQRGPDFAQAQWNRGHALLLQGDLQPGWLAYEWRWQATGHTCRFAQPLWGGDDLGDRTLLVHAEQGLGDTLQFLRYLPLIHQRGGRILLEVQAPLVGLITQQSDLGVAEVIPRGEALPSFDCQVPMLSLPRVFGTTLETIPAIVPYLQVTPEAITTWRQRCTDSTALKVGLVWAGSPAHKNDANRSVPLATLQPLLDIPNVQFISLQKELRPGDHERLAQMGQMTAWGELLEDFVATAAAIQALDLVLSVDTSVAHLAAALGQPVWVMLPFVPDWRWLLEREDSPWYPGMRLFRQPRRQDWPSVLHRIGTELARLVRAHCLAQEP